MRRCAAVRLMKHESLGHKFLEAALIGAALSLIFYLGDGGARPSLMEILIAIAVVVGMVIIWLLDDILMELRKR